MTLRAPIAVLALATAACASASPWNQFRGPNGSGVAPEGARPPTTFGSDTVAWKTPVPAGKSSPVVFGDRVFLTAIEDGGALVTLAFDRESGEQLWRKAAPDVPLEKVHVASSPAMSTPYADAERLYVYFGSFGLLCYDHEGKELWKRAIPTPKSLYGMSTSPIVYGDTLILALDNEANARGSQLSQSKLVAYKKTTGEIAWEAPRPRHRSGWSTPIVWRHERGDELVLLGNGAVRGYDAKDGTEKWFMGGFSKETVAVPVAGKGHVYVASAQLGGVADAKIDPAPFWEALMRFDADGDGKVARGEMTEQFTYPLRPELPLGHPGFGIPLPRDERARRNRQSGIFGWVDRDRDGFWTEEEWKTHMASKRGRPLLVAIRPGGEGDIEDSHVSWELNKSIPEVPSPLFYKDLIYMVRNGGLLAAVDAEEGDQLYRERLGGTGHYSASPVAAAGHLYLASERGMISVVKTGREFELAHQHELGEAIHVTPAIDGRTIYVRSEEHLWAFRKRD